MKEARLVLKANHSESRHRLRSRRANDLSRRHETHATRTTKGRVVRRSSAIADRRSTACTIQSLDMAALRYLTPIEYEALHSRVTQAALSQQRSTRATLSRLRLKKQHPTRRRFYYRFRELTVVFSQPRPIPPLSGRTRTTLRIGWLVDSHGVENGINVARADYSRVAQPALKIPPGFDLAPWVETG